MTSKIMEIRLRKRRREARRKDIESKTRLGEKLALSSHTSHEEWLISIQPTRNPVLCLVHWVLTERISTGRLRDSASVLA